MNIFSRTLLIPIFLASIMLASCNSSQSTPTMSDAEIMETAISTVSTTLAETQRAIPTNTPLPTFSLPTKTPTTHTLPTITLTPTPTVVPGPTGTPIFPPIESFVGIWHSSNPWPKIVIASDGSTLFANIRYACERPVYWTFPKDCELGLTSATYTGNPVLMIIDYGSETYNFTFSLNGDTLHVATFIDYTDNSGRTDETHEDKFSKEVYSFPESEQIVFYHFFNGPAHGYLGAIRTPILLVPAIADRAYTADTAADLRAALELVLQDESNEWTSRDLEIAGVTFRNGHADIVLQGEYSGENDEVLSAARMQILLTVFSNPAVQSAAVTLNGDTIGNLSLSSSTNAKPADYVYTRVEMETYLIEHYYSFEYGEFLDR